MSRSASPVMFGFDFQSNAAIILMIENMEVLNSVRVEGDEDIQLELNDGTYVLAQAKAVVNASTDTSNVRAKAKKAMESLSEVARKYAVKELIYFTNSPDPLKEETSRFLFLGLPSRVPYDDLPEAAKKLIDEFLSQIDVPLNTNKLKFQVLPFETDDDEQRYKFVKQKISDFVGEMNIIYDGLRNKLHDVWLLMLDNNGTKTKRDITLKKKDIIWPIIVYVTGHGILDRNAKYCTDLDEGEFYEIERKYGKLIQDRSELFDIVTRIVTDYTEKHLAGRDAIERFVNEYWKDYIEVLGITTLEETIRDNLAKIILYTILRKRFEIDRIKKSVKL